MTKKAINNLMLYMKYIVAGLLFFSTISLSAQTPEWLDLDSTKYPKRQYEIAVGEGKTLAASEQNALGNLSRIFGLTVGTDATSQVEFQNNALSKSASQSTTVSSSHNLVNASIAETSYDKNKSTYYALAVMPRQETIDILYKSIIENERIIGEYIESNEYESDSLYKFSFIDSAIELSKENDVLFKQYSILNQERSSTSLALSYKTSKLESDLRAITRSFGFQVQSDTDEAVKSALETSITDMGLKLNRDNPTYILSVDTTYSGTTSSYGVYILQYVSNIELSTVDGGIITTFMYSGKEGGKTQEAAEKVLYTRLSRLISEGDKDDDVLPFSQQFKQFLIELVK